MADGAWRNVLRVSVPSCRVDRYYVVTSAITSVGGGVVYARTHIFDLFHGKVGICWNADRLRSHVDDDHHGSRDVPLEQFVDLQIGRSQFRPCVVPPDHAFPRCTTRSQRTMTGIIRVNSHQQTLQQAGRQRGDAPLTFLNISNMPST